MLKKMLQNTSLVSNYMQNTDATIRIYRRARATRPRWKYQRARASSQNPTSVAATDSFQKKVRTEELNVTVEEVMPTNNLQDYKYDE